MPRDLTPGDGQDVLARFKAAREQRDVDAMLALFADEAELRPDPFGPPYLGSVAIREHWNQVAAEQRDVEFDAERIWVSGRTVLASWHAAWMGARYGDRLRERGFFAIELDDTGKAGRWRAWTVTHLVAHDAAATQGSASDDTVEDGDGR